MKKSIQKTNTYISNLIVGGTCPECGDSDGEIVIFNNEAGSRITCHTCKHKRYISSSLLYETVRGAIGIGSIEKDLLLNHEIRKIIIKTNAKWNKTYYSMLFGRTIFKSIPAKIIYFIMYFFDLVDTYAGRKPDYHRLKKDFELSKVRLQMQAKTTKTITDRMTLAFENRLDIYDLVIKRLEDRIAKLEKKRNVFKLFSKNC